MVLRLRHHDLESCTGAVQVVVDSVHELFSRVDMLALLGWLVATGSIADTLLDALRLLDIRDGADSASQRVTQTGISLLNLKLLSLGLESLLLGGPAVSLQLVGPLVEDFVDNLAAVEKLFEVFCALGFLIWLGLSTIIQWVHQTLVRLLVQVLPI